jgi:hypothetical protein
MHRNFPFTIIASLVDNASHSSMLWEVRTIEVPASRTSIIASHKCLLATGSIPDFGEMIL